MGTILKNIVQFTGLVVGVPTSLPHRLNVNGRPVAPKIGGADEGGFAITADTINVTVTRSADGGPDVNVYVEHWHTVEDVVPKIPPPGMLIGLTPLFFAGGGGGGAASQLLSLYGDGSFGDYATAGDETWTSDLALPPPGAPALPVGSAIEAAFFNNLTISAGDSVAVGGLSDQPSQRAVVLFVKGTLTIEPGARIHVNGGNGPGTIGAGLGRNAIIGSSNGADGAQGNPPFAAGPGNAGGGGTDRPAQSSATRIGGTGGAGGIGLAVPGGAGGTDAAEPSWPYSLTQAISIGSLLYTIGGGNGGGGGGNSSSSGGGAGGGGAGTLVIFARNIVAPAGALQAIGGNGAPGTSTENVPGGGGAGGTGGTIVIVTENTTLLGVTDVSGGAGGAGAGSPQQAGTAGGPGEAIAFNPMLLAQIPV